MNDFFNSYKENSDILYQIIIEHLIDTDSDNAEIIKYDINLYLKYNKPYPVFNRKGDIVNYRLSIVEDDIKSGVYIISIIDDEIDMSYEFAYNGHKQLIVRIEISIIKSLIRNKKFKDLNLD
jgi:hypothetical protein